MLFRLGAFRLQCLAEQPAAKAAGIFEADAAVGEMSVGLGEQVLLRGIVEVDAEIVGEHELDGAHGIAPAGQFANPRLNRSCLHRLPIDRGGADHLGLVGPIGQRLIALPFQRGTGQHLGRDPLAHQIDGDVPIGIQRRIAHHPGHHRSLRLGRADDDAHGALLGATSVIPQACGRSVNDDVTGPGIREQSRPLQIKAQQVATIDT